MIDFLDTAERYHCNSTGVIPPRFLLERDPTKVTEDELHTGT